MPLHPDTLAVTAGRPNRAGGAPLNAPIVPASTYHAGGEPVYGRDGNPGWVALEEALGLLEGGTCVAFGSGLAASAAMLDELAPGSVVVAQAAPYYGVMEQLLERQTRGAIALRTVAELTPGTLAAMGVAPTLVWIESPTNPMLDVIAIADVAATAHRLGAAVIVDSTFATPVLQTPIALGADVVMHSATKLIGGHSDLLLGALIARDPAVADRLRARRSSAGSTPGSLEAFLALRGLRTLPVRVARMQASAAVLARLLADHPAVSRVRYPGFGTMVSFETTGTGGDAEAVCDGCRLAVHATSLGGVESTLERRAQYAAERAAGTPETLIRLSVGLEHPDDLWDDLQGALAQRFAKLADAGL